MSANVSYLNSPPATHQLLARLSQLVESGEVFACVRVQAKCAHTLHAVSMDAALIVLPLEGKKRVRYQHDWIHVSPGEIFLVPHPQVLDIENIPDSSTGRYLAIGLPLQANVLEAARQLIGDRITYADGAVASVPLIDHLRDFNDWLDAMEHHDVARARLALVGLILRLYEQGHRGLLQPVAPTLAARIRAMIAIDPAREWSSQEVEAHLAMSGATLRRKLATEGTGLREVVMDARLSQGLTLLSTTDLPVKAVAARVGYISASTFAKRFTERYGVEPSQLCNE